MIPDSTSIVVLVLVVPVLIFIMLLPTIVELKKPRDEESHVIIDDTALLQTQIMNKTSIGDIDIVPEFDKETKNALSEVIKLIPNLEA